MTFEEYFKLIIDMFMIFGPNIGYIAQILKFREVNSSEGFSKMISFILLMANILGIFFWIGKQFSVVLLYQSIVAIIMQLILLRECLLLSPQFNEHYKNNNDSYKKPINLLNIRSFWNWPFLIDYIYVLLVISFLIGFISFEIGLNNRTFTEWLGAASATVEAIIAIPQVFSNYKNKNCNSLSLFMLICWASGDSFKNLYYLKTLVPLQLLLCGLFQLATDAILIGQYLYYTYIIEKKEIKWEVIENNVIEFGDDESEKI